MLETNIIIIPYNVSNDTRPMLRSGSTGLILNNAKKTGKITPDIIKAKRLFVIIAIKYFCLVFKEIGLIKLESPP
jgi:hypothetical protein